VTLSGARLQQIARDTAASLDDVSHGHQLRNDQSANATTPPEDN
jgi:hypothetical protein